MSHDYRSEPLCHAMTVDHDAGRAAAELADQLRGDDLGFVLFFCSAEYNLDALSKAMETCFAGVDLAGCTTAGEITPIGYAQGTACAIGFSRHWFAVETARIDELDCFGLARAQNLVDGLISRCHQRGSAGDGDIFALTLLDGLSSQEETVLVALDAAFGRIPHFGGSAGDDIQLANTHIFHRGAFRTQSAVIVMIKTPLEFEVFTTHHMQALEHKLVVTASKPDIRTVLEFNAEPAAEAYAAMIGIGTDQLNPDVYALNPLAVRIGDEYYVRSIQSVNPDLSLTFYCAVGNGIVLTAMEPLPILPDLERCFKAIEGRIGQPLMTIGCDCFLRRLETEHLGGIEEASDFFIRHRVIGFNTYGEHFGGVHINQTFTGVVIGRPA